MKQAAKNIKIQMYLGNHRGLCWKHSFTYLGNKGIRSNKNKKSANFSKNTSEKIFYLVSRPYIFCIHAVMSSFVDKENLQFVASVGAKVLWLWKQAELNKLIQF